jgi:hypothetical protein
MSLKHGGRHLVSLKGDNLVIDARAVRVIANPPAKTPLKNWEVF